MSMTAYGVTAVVSRCKRCGSAFRHYRDDGAEFCTGQCGAWERADRCEYKRVNERAKYEAVRSLRIRELATTPLHEMYPGMVDVIERVARMRPSWAEWQRSVDRRAAVWRAS